LGFMMKRSTMSVTTRLLVSIFGGELITLLTGLVSSTPPMLVGAVHYGYPLTWLIRLVIAPQYNPWRIELLNFFADIVIWFIVVAVVVFILARAWKPAST